MCLHHEAHEHFPWSYVIHLINIPIFLAFNTGPITSCQHILPQSDCLWQKQSYLALIYGHTFHSFVQLLFNPYCDVSIIPDPILQMEKWRQSTWLACPAPTTESHIQDYIADTLDSS